MRTDGREAAPEVEVERMSIIGRSVFVIAVCLCACAATTAQEGGTPAAGWVEVGYDDLVDMRQPSHSGESVAILLARLQGRPMPAPGTAPGDRLAHVLLDPLLEPYAFVLTDALDTMAGVSDPPMMEIGSLWESGETQPAWVELLRARRYVVESDGTGRLRICVPLILAPGSAPSAARKMSAAEAATRAWSKALPVMRHVLSAERRRLAAASGEGEPPPALKVTVYPYVHDPARTAFFLGTEPYEMKTVDLPAPGDKPPLDLASWQSFLDRGLLLEGARLDPDGTIRLLGSETDSQPGILGTPLTLADFAVAYRAVFHGGAAEPYMSLDRGYTPWTSVVNYGGRLRDTRLGMVALLCDIRFKTFSLGLDVSKRDDVRRRVREKLPSFRTHLERFATDPRAAGVLSQQTRLWFYPDDVDLTLSEEGDILVLRRVRMTAASERLQEGGVERAAGGEPPWTLETIRSINEHYDELAPLFPEMSDLDHVVRLLSLFTWLRFVGEQGGTIPDLDALLALELPALPTPRTFPQLLAFNALPEAGRKGAVDVFDRVAVALALERLETDDGTPLTASRRFHRAVGGLDVRQAEQAALREELKKYEPDKLRDTELDFLAYRADRLRMHHAVLSAIADDERGQLVERSRAGERLRVFSVGIGGLDLGMGGALQRASRRSLTLADTGVQGGAGRRPESPPTRLLRAPRRTAAPVVVGTARVPDHGIGPSAGGQGRRRDFGGHRIEAMDAADGEPVSLRIVTGTDGPEVRYREIVLKAGSRHPVEFRRFERGAFRAYGLEREADRIRARLLPAPPAATPAAVTDGPPVEGLAILRIDPRAVPQRAANLPPEAVPEEWNTVRVRFTATGRADLEADFPRRQLQRLVLGRDAGTAGDAVIPGLVPLPEPLGSPGRVLVMQHPDRTRPPFEGGRPAVPGEENPEVLARALQEWFRRTQPDGSFPTVAVGTGSNSAAAWVRAPAAGDKPLLLLPADAFPGVASGLEPRLRNAWRGGPVTAEIGGQEPPPLVVLVSAEPPGILARRLRALAGRPAMKGRLLAVWSLAGKVRPDLPASLLAEGNIAGLGVAGVPMVDWETVPGDLQAISDTVMASKGAKRVEEIEGSLLWFY